MSLMMMKTNPITPPPELVQQWYQEADSQLRPYYVYIATQAARWGGDQELEACVEWLDHNSPSIGGFHLRIDRRPNPPSLKEQALDALGPEPQPKIGHSWDTILNCRAIERHRLVRRALEALDD
jgi:hypothetical protein